MNRFKYVIVGAHAGLTEARGNLIAKMQEDSELTKKYISLFVDDSAEVDKIMETVDSKGIVTFNSTNKHVVQTCFKVMTFKYFASLI